MIGQLATVALCAAVMLGMTGVVGAGLFIGARNGIEFVTSTASVNIREMGRTGALTFVPLAGAVLGFMDMTGLTVELWRVALMCATSTALFLTAIGGGVWARFRGRETLTAASPVMADNVGRFVAIITAPLAVLGVGLLVGVPLTLLAGVGLAPVAFLANRARRRYEATGRFL